MLPTKLLSIRASLVRFSSPSPASTSKPGFKRYFWESCYTVEALPIWALSGGAILGGSWYLTRLARGPDVIWDRNAKPRSWEEQMTPPVSPVYSGEPYKRGRL